MATATNFPPNNDRKIVVGIDFGTTFSGVAWAQTHKPDTIECIQSWPGERNQVISGKVPTQLRYTGPGQFQWGFQIAADAPHDEVLECFKLALDPGAVPPESRLIKKNLRAFKADDLAADYLSALGNHLKQYLRETFPGMSIDTMPYQFVLTVPAMWTDLAKQRTVDSFKRAMNLPANQAVIAVSEPEAAATYVLSQMHRKNRLRMKVDDCFMVLDAGGGTVDLITYKIKGLFPGLEVSEAAPGSGAACGSAFLNERFEKLLQKTLEKEDGFENQFLVDAMDKFEIMIKRQFETAALQGETYTVPAPNLEDNKAIGLRRGKLTVKASELYTIFEPIVLEIQKLVMDQIATTLAESPGASIKAILLVGGFGQSTYLRERLETSIGEKRNIEIIQTENAWTAVVQGAVMKGVAQVSPLKPATLKVVDRKARKHYGTELSTVYDHSIHAVIQDKKRWDGLNGRWEVDTMNWFITKGDPLAENQPYLKSFLSISRVEWGRPQRIMLTIYADDKSPKAPLIIDDNVAMLCNVEADLSDIPEHQLTKQQGQDGYMYYNLSCQIEIVYKSASTAYTLIHKGQRYDTVSAEHV